MKFRWGSKKRMLLIDNPLQFPGGAGLPEPSRTRLYGITTRKRFIGWIVEDEPIGHDPIKYRFNETN